MEQQKKLFLKEMAKRKRTRKRKKQQCGFLSRYDFAYAGCDSVNQAAKHVERIAPRIIDKSFD